MGAVAAFCCFAALCSSCAMGLEFHWIVLVWFTWRMVILSLCLFSLSLLLLLGGEDRMDVVACLSVLVFESLYLL